MAVSLVYLHGVGNQKNDPRWRPALDRALSKLGYPTTAEVDLIEPDYRLLLNVVNLPKCAPPPHVSMPKSTALDRRTEYEIAQSSMRRLLGIDETSRWRNLIGDPPKAVIDFATKWSEFPQAKRYMDLENLRALIARQVLESLPTAPAELVIIGHSLGSLVALDLLDYLPEYLVVRRLVTIGSPAGNSAIHAGTDRLLRSFPFGRVRSWLNAVAVQDVVTAGRGVSRLIPAAQDLMFTGRKHEASAYLTHPRVAQAVGEALFGSLKSDLAVPERAPTLRLSDPEGFVVFAIAFAHRVADAMHKQTPEATVRYRAALRIVQSGVADALAVGEDGAKKSIHPVLAELASGRRPDLPRRWADDLDMALRLLVTAATTNLVEPFEIDAERDAQLDALAPASIALGFGPHHGRVVRQSLEDAKRALGSGPWARVMLAAAGIALVAAGPIGLMAAAPTGLAGAAAITSALAAFGPGGMVGGMAVAATLIGSGAATTAAVLAKAPIQVLELELIRLMAHADARKGIDLANNLQDWYAVVALESQLSNALSIHETISDKDSPIVKSLKRKRELVQKAIAWMIKRDLGPPRIEGR